MEEGDRAPVECQEWELLSKVCLGLIDKSNQERKKKRTKELDFLSPAVFLGHKASTLALPSFFSSFELFLRKYLLKLIDH